MCKRVRVLLLLFLVVGSAKAELPGIEELASLPPIDYLSLSPSGSMLAMTCKDGDVYDVCIVDPDDADNSMRFGVSDEAEITRVRWADDTHVLVYIQQVKNVVNTMEVREVEYNRIYSFNIKNREGVVLLNNLGGNFAHLTDIVSLVEGKPEVLMQVSVRNRDDRLLRDVHIYKVDLENGEGERVHEGERSAFNLIYTRKGELIAEEQHHPRSDSYRLVSALGDEEEVVFREDAAMPPLNVWGLLNGGQSLLVRFDDERGYKTISLDNGEVEPFKFGSEVVGERATPLLDYYNNNEVVGVDFWDGLLSAQRFSDDRFRKVHDALSSAMQGVRVTLESWSGDHRRFIFMTHPLGRPGKYYSFDLADGIVDYLGSESPIGDQYALGQVRSVSYTAADSLEINAFLTTPPEESGATAPYSLILLPHGGPAGHDDGGFHWLAQYIASLGYAVLQPNYRGSTGYGAAFRQEGFGEYGGKMVSDVMDGYRYLVQEDIAEGGRVGAVGWSYGGYQALQLSADYPGLVECVVAINAVTDPQAQRKHEGFMGDWSWEYYEEYLGADPDDAVRPDYVPLERVNQIKAPVLMIHGKHDTTVPFTQADRFRGAMDERPEEVFRFVAVDAADHYFTHQAQRERVLQQSAAWLKKHFPVKQ